MGYFNAMQRSGTTSPVSNDSMLRIGRQTGLRETSRSDVESGAKVGKFGRGPNDEGRVCHRVISLEEYRLSHRQICLCLHLLF